MIINATIEFRINVDLSVKPGEMTTDEKREALISAAQSKVASRSLMQLRAHEEVQITDCTDSEVSKERDEG